MLQTYVTGWRHEYLIDNVDNAVASTSAVVTVASPILTPSPVTVNDALSPFTITADIPSVTSDAVTFPYGT